MENKVMEGLTGRLNLSSNQAVSDDAKGVYFAFLCKRAKTLSESVKVGEGIKYAFLTAIALYEMGDNKINS